MKYLLDTNIISDIVRNPHGIVSERFVAAESGAVGTSIIAAAELRSGYVRVGSQNLERSIEAILRDIEVASFEPPADMTYARIRTLMESRGLSVGQNDMLIAAHALALQAVLVTNDRIFSHVPGLKVENWLRPQVVE